MTGVSVSSEAGCAASRKGTGNKRTEIPVTPPIFRNHGFEPPKQNSANGMADIEWKSANAFGENSQKQKYHTDNK